MDSCRMMKKNTNCFDPVQPEACSCKKQSPLSVSLPFGVTLRHNGEEWFLEGTASVADGTYSEIMVADGVIVSASVGALPEIVPAPCTPRPGSGSGSGEDTSIILDPAVSNTLSWSVDGRLKSQVFLEGSDSVRVTGLGSIRDPFVVDLVDTEQEPTFVIAGTPAVITVEGSGTRAAPFVISHVTGRSGVYEGFTFDDYGHLTGYDSTVPKPYISSVSAGVGVEVSSPATGMVTISLPSLNDTEVTYRFGDNSVAVDPQGRVKNIQPVPVAPAGDYDGLMNNFRFDSHGLLAAVTPAARSADFAFRYIFLPGRTSTSMNINPNIYGKLRISYRGVLGDAIKEDPGGDEPIVYYDDGFYDLPLLFQIRVDNTQVPCYVWVASKKFVAVEALFATPVDGSFLIGRNHSVSLVAVNVVQYDLGIMDVDLCQ